VRAIVLLLALAGCREEPTIVIKFEPAADAAQAPRAASVDAAPAAAAAPVAVVPVAEKARAAECKSDDDCTVEPVECCDCANGGKQQAVAKARAAASKKARAARCKETMCMTMLSNDPSCLAGASCDRGQCVLAAPKPAARPKAK
jgi:hypothetical protein